MDAYHRSQAASMQNMQVNICYLAPSQWLLMLLSGFYLNSAVALSLLAWSWLAKAPLLLLLCYRYVQDINLAALRNQPTAIAAVGYNEQYWYVLDGRQVRFKGKLSKASYSSNFLIVLHLWNAKLRKKILIPITRDALPEAEYRYLAAGVKL